MSFKQTLHYTTLHFNKYTNIYKLTNILYTFNDLNNILYLLFLTPQIYNFNPPLKPYTSTKPYTSDKYK